MKSLYPYISTDFKIDTHTANPYQSVVERIMHHVLPPNFFAEEDALFRLSEKLPLICWTPLKEPPFDLSFFMWTQFRSNSFRFFYEMVSRWLIPGKRLNALAQCAVDFTLPELSCQKYVAGEVMVRIESYKELEILQKNLPIIEAEIKLGIDSYYQACRILEIKGLTCDEKTALIQENMVSLIKHRPQDFDYDILSEMQHFLVLCKEEFKQARCWRLMSRIICVHYLFRKSLKFSLEVYPERRYIYIKLIRSKIHERKRVLGVAIGMSFLKENERFEAQHILNGVQSLLPQAKKIEGSFFCHKSKSDPTLTIYFEIENGEKDGFSLEEERLLKEELASELKNRIEQRVNPIFMPQNEEVIMRHILTLSGELKYARDLPQVIIDFAEQKGDKLEFLVVALRVVKSSLKSIAHCFDTRPTFLEFLPDRTKMIGWLRKKYKKEASVFRLKIHKERFLRKDFSVDLTKARQEVVKELERVMGEFRDYNGGTISKENELFESLRQAEHENPFLLENFFYSLQPPVMRSVLPVDPLKKLFKMLLEAEKEGLYDELPYQIRMEYDENYMYLLVVARDSGFRQHLMPSLKPYSGKIATCSIQHPEIAFFGLIFRDPDEEEGLKLRLSIEQTMAELYALHYRN